MCEGSSSLSWTDLTDFSNCSSELCSTVFDPREKLTVLELRSYTSNLFGKKVFPLAALEELHGGKSPQPSRSFKEKMQRNVCLDVVKLGEGD